MSVGHLVQVMSSPVLLFDVSEDLHVLSSNLLAISQQVSSACIQEALVSHVRKDKTLSSDEIQTCEHIVTSHCCVVFFPTSVNLPASPK